MSSVRWASHQRHLPSASSTEVERRVDSILGQMTLEEKIDLLGGVDGFFIREVPRLNLPRLKMADGPSASATLDQLPRLPEALR